MNLPEIARRRLIQQQIASSKFKSAKDIVRWMGAVQAQDYAMAKWAVGMRMPGSTLKSVESALNKGEIIRTHLLRPTWHFVSAEDIHWMLELTAPHIRSSMRARHIELELTGKVLEKSNALIEKSLQRNDHLTRDELKSRLTKAKIPVDNNRSSHILLWAELGGLICSGADKGRKQTYALLSERVPKTKALSREDALAKLARIYFTSHGPATLQDFYWWSGLPVADARNALEMIKPELASETVGSQSCWFSNSLSVPKRKNDSAYLLPAFDEFLISYKDRSAALTFGNHKRSVSDNGIFRPVIVINGQVTGLWKRAVKGDMVMIEAEYFRPHTKTELNWIKKAANAFGGFLGMKAELKHSKRP